MTIVRASGLAANLIDWMELCLTSDLRAIPKIRHNDPESGTTAKKACLW